MYEVRLATAESRYDAYLWSEREYNKWLAYSGEVIDLNENL
jgi:hypothetical protein